jgi:predicted ATPase
MYIESVEMTRFKCFDHEKVEFEYDGRHRGNSSPALPNVNLVLGDNGTGKTTILQAAILGILSQVIQSSGFRPYLLVRRLPLGAGGADESDKATAVVKTKVCIHGQDAEIPEAGRTYENAGSLTAQATITQTGTTEIIASTRRASSKWAPVFDDNSEGFFIAAYGASRRVENIDSFDSGARNKARSPRYQRVASLFEDAATLRPLDAWQVEAGWSPGRKLNRYGRSIDCLHSLLPDEVRIGTVPYDDPEDINLDSLFLKSLPSVRTEFNVRGTYVPFSSLSDGYRGFVGWAIDLLYHMERVVRFDQDIREMTGVVIVDEIDLLLHPSWQRDVIGRLAKTFPRIQFILTSHSPIVAGTVESANIILTSVDETGKVTVSKSQEQVSGLSADQILGGHYFGLNTSRSPRATSQLRDLAARAWNGDKDAAAEYLRRAAEGFEPRALPAKEIRRRKPAVSPK